MGVRYLLCIGGDDTTFGAAKIAEASRGRIGVVTVPKTIDNDLPLPDNAPTFGFETARAVGAGIVESLMEDARTTGRWYLAVSMGRKSGALALGMCKSAGATLAVIPEEFHPTTLELNLVVDTIVGSIIKRMAWGRDDGVALVAEGIAEKLDPGMLAKLDSGLSGTRRVWTCSSRRRPDRIAVARANHQNPGGTGGQCDRGQQGYRLRIALRQTVAV